MTLSITARIKKHLKDMGKTQASLAAALKESPQNLANKLRKNDLDTRYIRQISVALDHDFFQDLSQELQQELRRSTTSRPPATTTLGDAHTGYIQHEQYIRVLEENNRLYQQLLEANKRAGEGPGI